MLVTCTTDTPYIMDCSGTTFRATYKYMKIEAEYVSSECTHTSFTSLSAYDAMQHLPH